MHAAQCNHHTQLARGGAEGKKAYRGVELNQQGLVLLKGIIEVAVIQHQNALLGGEVSRGAGNSQGQHGSNQNELHYHDQGGHWRGVGYGEVAGCGPG